MSVFTMEAQDCPDCGERRVRFDEAAEWVHDRTDRIDCTRCDGCGEILHDEPNGDGATFVAHPNGAHFCAEVA